MPTTLQLIWRDTRIFCFFLYRWGRDRPAGTVSALLCGSSRGSRCSCMHACINPGRFPGRFPGTARQTSPCRPPCTRMHPHEGACVLRDSVLPGRLGSPAARRTQGGARAVQGELKCMNPSYNNRRSVNRAAYHRSISLRVYTMHVRTY